MPELERCELGYLQPWDAIQKMRIALPPKVQYNKKVEINIGEPWRMCRCLCAQTSLRRGNNP